MIEQTLSSFGLKNEEIKTFLFLLEHGSHTAGILAKKTGMSRPSLYGFVRKLQTLGLVVESQKNSTKVFSACTKEKVLALFDEKLHTITKGKAVLEKAYAEIGSQHSSSTPKFQLFESKKQVVQILKDILLYRDISLESYWPVKLMVEVLGEDVLREFNKKRIQQRLAIRAIWPETQKLSIKAHPYLGAGKDFLREIRIAPKHISFSMGYWIYGSKVAFVSSKKESVGFIIESTELVDMLRSQFEVLWQSSKMLEGSEMDGRAFLNEL